MGTDLMGMDSRHFADAVCRRGERCLYLACEEAPSQIIRIMASIGCDLEQWVRKGLLRFHAVRSTLYGFGATPGDCPSTSD